MNEIVPVNAALDLSGTVTVQTVSAGSLTVNGSGRLNVGSLNAAISGDSTGSVRVVYQSCGAEALRQLQKLTLSGGERFSADLPAVFRGTEVPLVLSSDPDKNDTAYAALPAPEDGKTYKARVNGQQILIYLSDEPQEYVLSQSAASVLNVEGSSAVLTSEENATQSAQVSAANLTLQSARTSGSLSLSGMSSFRAEGGSAFSQMILDASAGLSLRLGGRLSLHGLVNNGSLSVQGSGVLEVGELSGSGSYTIDPQCNFSVEPLPDAIGGLVPTQIQILGEENHPIVSTRVQLKLGSGESFLTTTDGRGCITLWRSEKLHQVDAVALSGGDTYSAVILNGQADADAVPEITSATLTNRGVVSVTLKNAGVWGVQYIVGSAPVSMPDSWNASAQTLLCRRGRDHPVSARFESRGWSVCGSLPPGKRTRGSAPPRRTPSPSTRRNPSPSNPGRPTSPPGRARPTTVSPSSFPTCPVNARWPIFWRTALPCRPRPPRRAAITPRSLFWMTTRNICPEKSLCRWRSNAA
ncbi:MAG: hypothetical protein ACLUE8_08980 [Lachnospiraceae bacterium]